jgi:predicted transport protein
MTGSSECALYMCCLILIMKANYRLPKKHLTLQLGVSRYSTIASCARNCTTITVFGSENLDCIFRSVIPLSYCTMSLRMSVLYIARPLGNPCPGDA